MRKFILLITAILSIVCLGATAQTLVKDIRPGAQSSALASLTRMGNHLYFVAVSPGFGVELWKSDGTEAGTVMVKDINVGNGAGMLDPATNLYSRLVTTGTDLYFAADDGTHGFELWKSDGTEAGTVMIKDLEPGAGNGADVKELIAIGNTIFFRGNIGGDWELYKSDGTAAGTDIVKNIHPSGNSLPEDFFELNGQLIFVARDDLHGRELWKSDGTTAGTTLLKDIYPGPSNSEFVNPTIYNGHVYFTSYEPIAGIELYRTDGTPVGTTLVKDIRPGAGSSNPSGLSVFNGKLFFGANDGVNDVQLWSSDGTAIGTSLFKIINPSSFSSPSRITTYNGMGYFEANDGVNGRELWVTDGTAAGTVMFLDINNSVGANSNPDNMIVAGGRLYFTATDGTNGNEPWSTDGTVASTTQQQVCPGPCNSFPVDFVQVGNKLFFSADGDNTGRELYVFDNLPVGVADIKSDLQFSIYPNPATSQLVVQAEANSIISIYDLQGRQMIKQTAMEGNNNVDVSSLASGMYVVQVTNALGETGVKKFVKE